MNSFRDVISAMGGPVNLANEIGGKVNTVISWKQRNSIPPGNWARIVRAAERSGVPGISFETLGRIAATTHQSDAA